MADELGLLVNVRDRLNLTGVMRALRGRTPRCGWSGSSLGASRAGCLSGCLAPVPRTWAKIPRSASRILARTGLE